jgi:hypothetical protein
MTGEIQKLINMSTRPELASLQNFSSHDGLLAALNNVRQQGFKEVEALLSRTPKLISLATLQQCLDIGPSDAQVDRIVASLDTNNPILKELPLRFKQISQATKEGFEEEPMPARDMLAIALFVQNHFSSTEKTKMVVDEVLQKQKTGLTRTLQVSETGHVFIIAGEKSKLRTGGSDKKIRSAAGFALQNYSSTLMGVRSYSKVGNSDEERATAWNTMQATFHDLHNKPGFLPIHAMCTYGAREGSMPHISMISERYENQDKLSQKMENLTRPEKAGIAYDILQGLAFLHENNQFHGNLNPDNIIARKIQGKYQGAITGFDSWGQVASQKADPRIGEAIWFGTLLWHMFYEQADSIDEINNLYQGFAASDPDGKNFINSEDVQNTLAAQNTKEGTIATQLFSQMKTDEQKLKWIMFQCLKGKITMPEAHNLLKKAPPAPAPQGRGSSIFNFLGL